MLILARTVGRLWCTGPRTYNVLPAVALRSTTLSPTNKYKHSGPSALTQLRKFHGSMVIEGASESDPIPDDPFLDKLMKFIAMSRTNSSTLALSTATGDEILERFNIVRKGVLYLHSEATLRQAVNATRTIGSEKLWSDDMMYSHLACLARTFTDKNGTSTRTIVDTFFFRSTSMVPCPQKVIMMVENHASVVHSKELQMGTISGIVDYTAIIAESAIAQGYVHNPPPYNPKYGLTGHSLEGHLPQVLLELVACVKCLGRHHIRGALTTGFTWIFVVVDLDGNGNSAKYWISTPIQWMWDIKNKKDIVSPTITPALIAGILSSWIPESFVEFKGDQWFVQGVEEESVRT